MNHHQRIKQEMERQYEALADVVYVFPAALAQGAFDSFAKGDEELNLKWASLEHMKQMAREFLRGKKGHDGKENETHNAQGEFEGEGFSGRLQDRYPTQRKAGEDPGYKLRSELTAEERAWNVDQLRKSADARQEHADALEAEGQAKDTG